MMVRAASPGVSVRSTVSIRVLRALVEAVEHAGVARDQLLRAAELAPDQLDDADARVSYREVFRVCELALDLTHDPALGLHWGERQTGSSFVPLSHMLLHAPSLRQGFAALSQFERLLSDERTYELVEHGDEVTLRCLRLVGESVRVQRFAAEMIVTNFFRLIRAFSHQAHPVRVSFEHAAPDYRDEYTRVFEQEVRFAQPFTELTFELAVLNAPSPHKDEGVHEALRTLAQRRITRLTEQTPYALRARELLVKQWPERGNMDTVARSLGLSVRSLRRRLDAEGKSYSEVENDALAIVATHLIQGRQLSIQETARAMGFSETTAFHRAFKRWTGTTPSAFQKRRQR